MAPLQGLLLDSPALMPILGILSILDHGHGSIIDGFTGLEIGKLYIPDNDNPGDIKVLDLGNFYEEAHNIIGQAISAEELRLLKGVPVLSITYDR